MDVVYTHFFSKIFCFSHSQLFHYLRLLIMSVGHVLLILASCSAVSHNPAEYFIQPVGPRFIGHFYDTVPDSCYPSGDAAHVMFIAAGQASTSGLIQAAAHITEMSKKGYFPTQFYFHFVVDNSNMGVVAEWRRGFEHRDGHMPLHSASRLPKILAVVNKRPEQVQPRLCGVLHHFEHMCSHMRLHTLPPLSQDFLNTDAELMYREHRCRHSYGNIKQYFDTEVSDLIDPPRHIILAREWYPTLLDLPMLRNLIGGISSRQILGIHVRPRPGASKSDNFWCGHLSELHQMAECEPSDGFLLLSLANDTALAEMDALVLSLPLETPYLEILWNSSYRDRYLVLPNYLTYHIVPSVEKDLDEANSTWFSYPYHPPDESLTFLTDDNSSANPLSYWCPPSLDLFDLGLRIVGRQWVSGRFCDILEIIPDVNTADDKSLNKDEESIIEQTISNPFVAVVDNGAFGVCAAAWFSEQNYSNWALLTSYVQCTAPMGCAVHELEGVSDRDLDPHQGWQWEEMSGQVEEASSHAATDTGTTDGLTNLTHDFMSRLRDRLLPSYLWRFDLFSETFWKSESSAKSTVDKYLTKRYTRRSISRSVQPVRRSRIRRPVANISTIVRNGPWELLLSSLDKSRVVGLKDKPIDVSAVLPEERTLILGRNGAYAMTYDKLIIGLPVDHVHDLLQLQFSATSNSIESDDQDRSDDNKITVAILKFLFCGSVVSKQRVFPSDEVVSALLFEDDEMIFYRVTLDRRPHVDGYVDKAALSCGMGKLYTVTAEVSSSATVFIPSDDSALSGAVEVCLQTIGLWDSTEVAHRLVHRYSIQRVSIELESATSVTPNVSNSKVQRMLSSAHVLHSSRIRTSIRDIPLQYSTAEAACLAGVLAAKQAIGSPDTAAPPPKDAAAQYNGMELTFYTVVSQYRDIECEKYTSAKHADRMKARRAEDKRSRSAPDRRTLYEFKKISQSLPASGMPQVNVFNIRSNNVGIRTNGTKFIGVDTWDEDGDFHVWRPTLWSNIPLELMKGYLHPSAIALLAHLTYIIDRYDSLPDVVIFTEPSLPTDHWYFDVAQSGVEALSKKAGSLRTSIQNFPDLGVYSDIFSEQFIRYTDLLEIATSHSLNPTENVISKWRIFCKTGPGLTSKISTLCRPNSPYFFYSSRSLLRSIDKAVFVRMLTHLKELSANDIISGGDTFGADAGYLIALLVAQVSRTGKNHQRGEIVEECKLSGNKQTPNILIPEPEGLRGVDESTALGEEGLWVYPLTLREGRAAISEALFDAVFGDHMADSPRPVIRADDMKVLEDKALTVFVYDLPARFHRDWLEMGSTILCWQDQPWDRTPCSFLKSPHRSLWPRQRVQCDDGDASMIPQNDIMLRSCRVVEMEPDLQEQYRRSYHLSSYRTVDPSSEVVMLMRLLLSLRHATVTTEPNRADLFLIPYLASLASFMSRNIKASPILSDGPFPLSTILEHLPHLTADTQRKHVLLSSSECIGCIAADPGCVCCNKRGRNPKEFSWDWQVCTPHVLEEKYPEMIRFTLGPRRHGDKQHVIVPSLILDADHQPGTLPGGGSDYEVPSEEMDRYNELLRNRGEDFYISSGGENPVVVHPDGNYRRPIFLSVFTTFHPNLDDIFFTAMSNRERLVVSILSHLRRHGHVVNTTNLLDYKYLFEMKEDLINQSIAGEGSDLHEQNLGKKKVLNILVHVGDLAAKAPFPSRRSFNHIYRRSIFCPIPPGDVPHGSRFFHAVLSGCIPVVLTFNASIGGFTSWHMEKGAPYQDSYPFVDKIDYRKIVVEISGNNIDSIVEILQEISEETIAEKQAYMRKIRNYFINDFSGSEPDLFSLLLSEILDRL